MYNFGCLSHKIQNTELSLHIDWQVITGQHYTATNELDELSTNRLSCSIKFWRTGSNWHSSVASLILQLIIVGSGVVCVLVKVGIPPTARLLVAFSFLLTQLGYRNCQSLYLYPSPLSYWGVNSASEVSSEHLIYNVEDYITAVSAFHPSNHSWTRSFQMLLSHPHPGSLHTNVTACGIKDPCAAANFLLRVR